MKADIHPKYVLTTYNCTCGNSFQLSSTMGAEAKLEICNKCHPFYTGKDTVMDTAGRIERFKRKYSK